MKFTILISAALASVVSAGCYSSGATFPSDHSGTVEQIENAANYFAGLSPLGPGEHVKDIPFGGKCLHFILDNISGSDRTITSNEAEDGLLKEYAGCQYGGDTSYTNWRYV